MKIVADDGAHTSVAIRNCKLLDMMLVLDPSRPFPQDPNYQGQNTGIKFEGRQSSSLKAPGRIDCEVLNLRLAGPFNQMAPSNIVEFKPDPKFPNYPISRIIEVFTEGRSKELGGAPIAKVVLELDSCVFDGHAGDIPPLGETGWDIGLYASAQFPDPNPEFEDFTSAFEITSTGSTFTDFRTQAIHCESDYDTRGSIWLNGGTEVSRTSRDRSPSILGNGEGVRIHTFEGYMGFHTEAASITDNFGDGISLFAEGSNQDSSHKWPTGVFIDMNHTDVHQNDGHGLNGRAILGAIGGTWKFNNSGVLFSDMGFSAPIEHGQGVINACAISNNGLNGIRIHARGDFLPGDGNMGLANLRIINSVIWNHPLEGIRLEMDATPFCFVPIVHSTVAGNGDLATSLSNMELEDYGNGNPFMYRSESWGSQIRVLTTKIYNSIFQRKLWTSSDIGPVLATMLVDEFPVSTGNTIPTKVGVAGSRGRFSVPVMDFNFIESTGAQPPFKGPIVWTSILPSQFFYEKGLPVNSDFDNVTGFLHIDETESAVDYEGSLRPSGANHFNRDKGGDHEDDA